MSDKYWSEVDGATLRLTPAQLARLEAAGWVPGSGALEEWLVQRAEQAAPKSTKAEERARAAGWDRDDAGDWYAPTGIRWRVVTEASYRPKKGDPWAPYWFCVRDIDDWHPADTEEEALTKALAIAGVP